MSLVDTSAESASAARAGLDEWRALPRIQQPTWPDEQALEEACAELRRCPPLIFAGEADLLKERLAEVAAGRAFLLQGGDCAETFAGATADQIRNRIKTVLQMAAVLTYGAAMPVVKMGRMAGQLPSHARPTSKFARTSHCPPTAVTRSTISSSPRPPAARTHGEWCAPITRPRRR